ncbi:MAG TPA: gas vesicle protein GvpO [Jatrophihabitans sp.]|jgi:hypothetical protein
MSDSANGAAPTTDRPARQKRAPSPLQIVERARKVLDDLGGMTVDRVIGVEAEDDEWRVVLEVVELRRIPNTSDVVARYEVRMSRAGKFRGYRQVARRLRSQVEEY